MKKSFLLLRIMGGITAASGFTYVLFTDNKIGYLFGAIGCLMILFYQAINNRVASGK